MFALWLVLHLTTKKNPQNSSIFNSTAFHHMNMLARLKQVLEEISKVRKLFWSHIMVVTMLHTVMSRHSGHLNKW